MESHIRKAFGSSGGVVAPDTLMQNLHHVSKHLRFGRQEDAHEFLCNLLSSMGGDSKSKSKTHAHTALSNIFGGKLMSSVLCHSCGYDSITLDPSMDLSLELAGSVKTITDALAHFTATEKLDKANQYKCDKCKHTVQASKKFSIKEAPRILVLQLKRFDFMRGGKVSKHIEFDDVLDISPFMSKGSPKVPPYELYGVVIHAGRTMNSGHYYAYVRVGSDWFCMDDSHVSKTTFSRLSRESAYILCYANSRPDMLFREAEKLNCAVIAPVEEEDEEEPPLLQQKIRKEKGVTSRLKHLFVRSKSDKKSNHEQASSATQPNRSGTQVEPSAVHARPPEMSRTGLEAQPWNSGTTHHQHQQQPTPAARLSPYSSRQERSYHQTADSHHFPSQTSTASHLSSAATAVPTSPKRTLNRDLPHHAVHEARQANHFPPISSPAATAQRTPSYSWRKQDPYSQQSSVPPPWLDEFLQSCSLLRLEGLFLKCGFTKKEQLANLSDSYLHNSMGINDAVTRERLLQAARRYLNHDRDGTQSNSYGRGQSHSQSYGQGYGQGYGQTYGQNYGQSHNQSYGQSHNQSYGQSHSQSYGQSHSQSYGQSQTQSHGQNQQSTASSRASYLAYPSHAPMYSSPVAQTNPVLPADASFLFSCVRDGWLHDLNRMLEDRADVNSRDRDGSSLLQSAAIAGHKSIVGFLLSRNADVNAQDRGGRTALHHAIAKGHVAIAEELLKRGADGHLADNNGHFPGDLRPSRYNY